MAIHVETSITDGPGGDSALVVSDGTSRLVNQNDCRTTDLAALAAHGPVDLHWLQYSGAIWYPMVYEMDEATMRHLVDAKVESQLARAMRYVESIDARAVVPSAGPPCFLDPELFHLNVVTGDEPSIFVDQRTFLARLRRRRPSRACWRSPARRSRSTPAAHRRRAPDRRRRGDGDLRAQGRVPRRATRPTGRMADEMHERWAAQPETDLVAGAAGVVGAVAGGLPDGPRGHRRRVPAARLGARRRSSSTSRPARCARYAGEPYGFRFDIDRPLVEKVVAERAVDWSNSLFLSCRFRAWRRGEFNEYVYNFFKSLSPERMRRTEAEALRKLHPPTETEPDIELDGWVMQRRCPHRNADLSVFGEVDGCELVCTLHGWRFDLETGKCLTTAGHELRVRRARSSGASPTRSAARGARVARVVRRRSVGAVHPDRDAHRHQVGVPDEVHRRDRHPHAPVRGRVVGHVVGAVHGLAAAEVLRPVDPCRGRPPTSPRAARGTPRGARCG